MDYTN